VDWPCGGDGADVTQPQPPGGTHPLGPPPPPGSSPASARTWNFERARRVAAVAVAAAVDGPPPAAERTDARSRSACVAVDATEEYCGAEGGTGDEAHWRASPQT